MISQKDVIIKTMNRLINMPRLAFKNLWLRHLVKELEAENQKLKELLHDLNAVLKTAMHNGHHDLIQRVVEVCKDEA